MLKKAMALKSEIIKWRRQIHMNPELSFNELDTAKLGSKILQQLGYTTKTQIGKTGVYGDLKKGTQNKCILIRGDMDALPIQEQTKLEFRSQNKGIMHACGHDSHVAMVLGAATLLKNENFDGTIRIVLQPSEETADSEHKSGALRMIEDGVLENVDGAIALHISPMLKTGCIGIKTGYVNASADEFKIFIKGKAAHGGATPHLGIDAIVIASHIVTAVQSLIARKCPPKDSAVITIGKIVGGDAQNIIAENVMMHGTMRTLSNETRAILIQELENIVSQCAQMFHGKSHIDWVSCYPPNYNHENLTLHIKNKTLPKILSTQNIIETSTSMGGEDFSIFSQSGIPTCFVNLGVTPENVETPAPLHSPFMTIDEEALIYGSAYLAQSALDFLHEFNIENNP